MEQPVITASIVVPAFNEEKGIARCIEGLLAQDYPREAFEVIIIDNNSSDRTFEIIGSYPVKGVLEKKRGRASARNAGIRQACGEFIVFLDADCVPEKGWLKTLLGGFKDESVGCVAGEILPPEPEIFLHQYLAKSQYFSQKITMQNAFLPFAQTGNAAYRKEVLDQVGLFDESLLSGQDADLSWRMQLETGKKVAFVESAKVYHPYPDKFVAYLKQRLRHAHGSVSLYTKYRDQMPAKSKKETYWEYRALVKSLCRVGWKAAAARFSGNRDGWEDDFFQVLGQTAVRCGRILGSIQCRVWYL